MVLFLFSHSFPLSFCFQTMFHNLVVRICKLGFFAYFKILLNFKIYILGLSFIPCVDFKVIALLILTCMFIVLIPYFENSPT